MESLIQLAQHCKNKGYSCVENMLLKNYTSFKIGGPARYFIEPWDMLELADILKTANQLQAPYFILGRGSNVLPPDDTLEMAVIYIGPELADIKVNGSTITAQAGVSLSRLCKTACEYGLSGLEFAYGIPGSVGGAVYMNAGAYGGEMKDVVAETRHLATDGKENTFTAEELQFSYRHSAYMQTAHCITTASFRLVQDDPALIKQRMDDYMTRRKTKQPLEYPSAGSTFKRPEGNYASALIDCCMLKGKHVGDAEVSRKHAGFIVNKGNATAAQVKHLIELVQKRVLAQTGYNLECEIRFL